MSGSALTARRPSRGRNETLLTANSEMRKDGVLNWTLPAWVVTLSDGSKMNVCPSAGACAKVCYARQGTYMFPDVKAAHLRNLERVLADVDLWAWDMSSEVSRRRPQHVRIHDSGDFFSDEYLAAWMLVARENPQTIFYAYTKEVSRFKRMDIAGRATDNFRWLYSLGGREDKLVDLDLDRHADVFPDEASLVAAGYMSQDESDLLVLTLPTTRIGIPANNIPGFKRVAAGRSFGEMQKDRER